MCLLSCEIQDKSGDLSKSLRKNEESFMKVAHREMIHVFACLLRQILKGWRRGKSDPRRFKGGSRSSLHSLPGKGQDGEVRERCNTSLQVLFSSHRSTYYDCTATVSSDAVPGDAIDRSGQRLVATINRRLPQGSVSRRTALVSASGRAGHGLRCLTFSPTGVLCHVRPRQADRHPRRARPSAVRPL